MSPTPADEIRSAGVLLRTGSRRNVRGCECSTRSSFGVRDGASLESHQVTQSRALSVGNRRTATSARQLRKVGPIKGGRHRERMVRCTGRSSSTTIVRRPSSTMAHILPVRHVTTQNSPLLPANAHHADAVCLMEIDPGRSRRILNPASFPFGGGLMRGDHGGVVTLQSDLRENSRVQFQGSEVQFLKGVRHRTRSAFGRNGEHGRVVDMVRNADLAASMDRLCMYLGV